MLISLHLAFYDENIKIVANRCEILSNYLTGWFWADFISNFPYELIPELYAIVKI